MRLNKKAGFDRLGGGIRQDFGAIKVQLFAPNQSFLLTLLHKSLKETPEDPHAIALTDTRQTRMIGYRFASIESNGPSDAEPISRMPHQLPFRAYPLKKHDEVQFEEH